jgi:hypothetical protein
MNEFFKIAVAKLLYDVIIIGALHNFVDGDYVLGLDLL